MSYLNFPRLIFSGQFKAAPSTVNNDPEHFDTATFKDNYDLPAPPNNPNGNGWWNPEGDAGWTFQNCKVMQVQYQDGSVCTDASSDPVVGMPITAIPGKLVDVDSECQMVSAIFGLQVFLGTQGGSMGFGGPLQTPCFGDIWAKYPQGKPDSFFGAYFQNVIDLTQPITGATPATTGAASSRFLKELQASIGNGTQVSMKFNVDGYEMDSTSPNFNLGRVVGSIGAYQSSEPHQFVSGRTIVSQIAAPFYTAAYAIVDGKNLQLDLGNLLPVASEGGPIAPFAALTITTGNNETIGTFPFPANANWYEQTAGIITLPLTASQTTTIASQPLAIQITNTKGVTSTLAAEASDGIYVRADDFVFRLNPPAEGTDAIAATLYLKYFGGAFPPNQQPTMVSFSVDSSSMIGQQVAGPIAGPPAGVPISALSFPGSSSSSVGVYQVFADANGVAKITVAASDPGNPRGYIDGQMYGVTYAVGQNPPAIGSVGNGSQLLNLLVFNAYSAPAQTTWWQDVYPIFLQYYDLYPIMRQFGVMLNDYNNVIQHKTTIIRLMSLPITNPQFMPVTRDLSNGKTKMILDWLALPNPPIGTPPSETTGKP